MLAEEPTPCIPKFAFIIIFVTSHFYLAAAIITATIFISCKLSQYTHLKLHKIHSNSGMFSGSHFSHRQLFLKIAENGKNGFQKTFVNFVSLLVYTDSI